jgi:4-amino-4-deoxychorismate lyase
MSFMHYCSINGQIQNVLSITDRAFSYGDGVFTTAKISQGKVELLPFHIKRLVDSCQQLTIPLTHIEQIINEVQDVAQQFSLAVLKIIISAGQGGRGYSRKGITQSNVIISVHDIPQHYATWPKHGITLGDSEFQLGLNPMLKGLKHLNRLEQVLIRAELDERLEDDLVVCDINGHVIEASSSNIFWLKDDKVFTPKLTDSGVYGLIRQQLLTCLDDIDIVTMDSSALTEATSIFICNCVMGIVPIKQYHNRALALAPVHAIQDKFIKHSDKIVNA